MTVQIVRMIVIRTDSCEFDGRELELSAEHHKPTVIVKHRQCFNLWLSHY